MGLLLYIGSWPPAEILISFSRRRKREKKKKKWQVNYLIFISPTVCLTVFRSHQIQAVDDLVFTFPSTQSKPKSFHLKRFFFFPLQKIEN